MNIQSLAFNNSVTLLTCGNDEGYTIYAVDVDNEIENLMQISTNESVSLVKILNKTNLCILVGQQTDKIDMVNNSIKDNEHLSVWDVAEKHKKRELIIDMKEPICNAHIALDFNNGKKKIMLIIVLKNKIHVFNHRGIRMCSMDTIENPLGIYQYYCTKQGDSIIHHLATLGKKIGEITLWNITNDTYKSVQAHKNNIVALAISKDGGMIATASEIGTLINVFETDKLRHLYQFRRGRKPAIIWDMCFDPNNIHLVCCGNTDKIHVFELYKDEEKTINKRSALGSILPGFMNPDYLTSYWSFEQVELYTKKKTICDFDEKGVLHIASYAGMYYKLQDYKIVEKSNLLI